MTSHLSSLHGQAIEKIFDHPARGNLERRETPALLENLGTVTEEHTTESSASP
jgi:hypothetical protein